MSKLLFILLILIMIIGCSSEKHIIDKGNYYIDESFTSISQNNRIKFLIFHYTVLNDARSLALLTQSQVSAHYLIPKYFKIKNGKPVIFNLVPENKQAWHAGLSNWNGKLNINYASIGIEVVNKGFTENLFGSKIWYPFTEKQISAIIFLSKDIIRKYNITPDNVLAHSDIAPLRKYDPGKLFPWKRLAAFGIGAWPDEITVKKYLAGRLPYSSANVLVIQQQLQKYGYDKIPQSGELDEETRKIISAFQLHFRSMDISGNPDAETEAIACALVEKYRNNQIDEVTA
ncbi:MAG: N-acetylmuramoyl-L-alanine amidase [Arsenophonus sp.]|nr:MAG: N-acetylmuramoyl-L-alanine amidase [Arsenophonus sp.]